MGEPYSRAESSPPGEKEQRFICNLRRGISEGKVVNLAIKAEIEGYQELANQFLKKPTVSIGESETAKRIRKRRRE